MPTGVLLPTSRANSLNSEMLLAYQLRPETANLLAATREERWAWKVAAAAFLFAVAYS